MTKFKSDRELAYFAGRYAEVEEKAKYYVQIHSRVLDRAKQKFRNKEITREEWVVIIRERQAAIKTIQKLFR